MSHAFGRGKRVEEPEGQNAPSEGQKAPPEASWGIFEEGALCSALTVCPFTVHWPGSVSGTLALGGVAGVATYAQARGRGHVERLLVESLAQMREAGQVVSALYPFSFAFYGRYGWGWVGEKLQATLPLRELPSGGRLARCADEREALELLPARYTQEAQRYRGAFVSGSRDFEGRVRADENRLTYLYVAEDGYLLWRYPAPGSEGPGEIREWIAPTPASERALLALLRDLGVQTRQARVTLPSDTTLLCQTFSWEHELRWESVFMGRVVDLAKALSALKTLGEGSLTLEVHDPHASWNQGCWTLTGEGGRLVVERTSQSPHVTLDIQTLSQAFFGSPSLARLRRAGKVQVHDEAGYHLLEGILPAASVMCWDGF